MDEAGPAPLTAATLAPKLPAVCRTCLAVDEAASSDPEQELYQIDEIFLEEDELTSQVHSFEEVLSLFVNDGIGKQDDRLPKTICLVCVEKARAAFQFIEMCRVTDSLLEECLSKPAVELKPAVKVDPRESEEVAFADLAVEDEQLNEEYEEVEPVESVSEYTDQSTKENFTLMYVEHEPVKKRNASTGSPSKRHECEICHKTFSQPQTLTRHKKIHSKDSDPGKPCEYCNRTFLRSDDLRRHIRIHTNERPYACNQCPRAYKQSFELKEHRDACHSEEGTRKMMDCKICGKQLTTRNGLYVHMKAHKGEKNHECLYCGKRFVTSGELTSHLRHIHPKEVNVKLIECGVGDCTRKFVTKAALRTHHVKKHAAEMSKVESGSE
uniref:Putative c2h2-type zn-finger protein n=1 Tax=Culex tarsalis TaxID=7177 RepID=A0A1Q3EZ25_CULTA